MFKPTSLRRALALFPLCMLGCCSVYAEQATVAVAANFAKPMESLAQVFESDSAHKLDIVTGSSGRLYAQIVNGAPFDVFLSADAIKPELLIKRGLAVPESRITYAVGKLALWSYKALENFDKRSALLADDLKTIAVANPRLAPYGLAAEQFLLSEGLWDSVQDKLVFGENISQTYQFVFTGNAESGFVSLSQLITAKQLSADHYWIVPEESHDPIIQDAVLLRKSAKNRAAVSFMKFLGSRTAEGLIKSFGYEVAKPDEKGSD